MGEGDLLLYGRLAEEMGEIPPEDFWQGLKREGERYLAAGADRADLFHRILDEMLDGLIARDQRFGYPPPFCHKGCSNCCHELVYCTSEEADLIVRHCQAAGIAFDQERLIRQLQHVETDAQGDHTGVTTWNDQPKADQSCVFLDEADGSCRIWAVRPMVCRAHLAEGTDAHCLPHNGQVDPEALGISYVETSYLLSAIFTIHRDSVKKTLGRLVLERTRG